MLKSLLDSPHFRAARGEMQAVGFRISDQPHSGSAPYIVASGRSNPRWWLLPVDEPAVTSSSLGLFQPILPGARILKGAASVASRLGMAIIWPGTRVYVSGTLGIAEHFKLQRPRVAFFTGTGSPHRKLVIQVMDSRGGIRGYVKVARKPDVQKILKHEASVLEQLARVELRSATIPTLLYTGRQGGAQVVAMDSRKTGRSQFPSNLLDLHLRFIEELAACTKPWQATSGGQVLHALRERLYAVDRRLTREWRERLHSVLEQLEGWQDLITPSGLAHGDFTPWNTFVDRGRLYVFDWEYAGYYLSADYDLIHFLSSLPTSRGQEATAGVESIQNVLCQRFRRSAFQARARIIAYFFARALLYAGREQPSDGEYVTWDGDNEAAAAIDSLTPALPV